MIVRRSLHPTFLSNSYLVASEPGGDAILIDAGAPIEPLLTASDDLGVRPAHLLITHEHHDHVEHAVALRERYGLDEFDPGNVADGAIFHFGALSVRVISTPGHCRPHVSFLVDDEALFTGDALFKGSVGGTMHGGPTGFADLRTSILDRLLTLPAEVAIYPGHTDATTVGAELEHNPFVRVWRGLAPEGTDLTTIHGEHATVIVNARDYDGGTKAWVRLADGTDVIVGGGVLGS